MLPDPQNLDAALLRRLRTFIEVAETASISDCARRLGVSQPAISQVIRALELDLGVALFDRSANTMLLTTAGEQSVIVARRILKQYVEGVTELREITGTVRRALRIGMGAPRTLLPLTGGFQTKYPAVRFTYVAGNARELMEMARNMEVDVAQVSLQSEPPDMHNQLIFQHKLVGVVSNGHPLAGRRNVKLADLCEHTIVLREQGSVTRQVFQDAMDDQGLVAEQVVEVPTREGVHAAAAAGIGIALVLSEEGLYFPNTKTVPIEKGAIRCNEYLSCNKHVAGLVGIRTFIDYCVEACRARDKTTRTPYRPPTNISIGIQKNGARWGRPDAY